MDRQELPPKLSALIEITIYLLAVSVLALLYALQRLDLRLAGVVVLVLLLALVLLSWIRLGQGRHPCFLFLCVFILFQAGRLIAAALGDPIDPYEIVGLGATPFGVSTDAQAVFLLALALSAICIYAPCRWNYRFVVAENGAQNWRGLRYLYRAFWVTFPFAIFENVLYFRYATAHGGYLVLFTDRADLIASVPVLVRAVSAFLAPIFLAIFVLERRRRQLYLSAGLYFFVMSFFLLLGSRSGLLTTILALWYVARFKSGKHSRPLKIALLACVLAAVAVLVGQLRDNGNTSDNPFTIASFFEVQGTTMGVTETAIQFRSRFSPYAVRYLLNEIESGLVPRDQSKYARGQAFADDVTVLINPEAYSGGVGLGSSCLGEAYVVGAMPGVICFSLLLGFGFHGLYSWCATRIGLFASAVLLPTLLWMARSGLFDWVSVVVRTSFLILVLYLGWGVYSSFVRLLGSRSIAGHGSVEFSGPHAGRETGRP